MILQITADGLSTWNIPHLNEIYQLSQIAGTILILVYVFYTGRMFNQIKKQTDYQQDAYLKVRYTTYEELPKTDNFYSSLSPSFTFTNLSNPITEYVDRNYIVKDPVADKIKTALKSMYKDLPDKTYEGDYITLVFNNYGNAVVDCINLKIKVTVRYNQEVAELKTLEKGDMLFTKNIGMNNIIGSKEELRVALISTASFPTYSIEISGTYQDVKGKSYPIPPFKVNGQNNQFHKMP